MADWKLEALWAIKVELWAIRVEPHQNSNKWHARITEVPPAKPQTKRESFNFGLDHKIQTPHKHATEDKDM